MPRSWPRGWSLELCLGPNDKTGREAIRKIYDMQVRYQPTVIRGRATMARVRHAALVHSARRVSTDCNYVDISDGDRHLAQAWRREEITYATTSICAPVDVVVILVVGGEWSFLGRVQWKTCGTIASKLSSVLPRVAMSPFVAPVPAYSTTG